MFHTEQSLKMMLDLPQLHDVLIDPDSKLVDGL